MAILRSRDARTGHAAGIFADMSLDGPHIGTLVVVIDRAKNLPNRRTMGKQDPYCAMRLGKEAKKTVTDRRGGQTPRWDTELRFNVHDSPDYMKLKASIFNDDKRTDLIGEAWIELSDVIKRGGGQADMWQQLTCKGKYAGELRIELTYYDSRERPAPAPVAVEKRRVRETIQAFSGAEDMMSEVSGPASRHIGPREIRRRPLPAGPIPSSTPTPSIQSNYEQHSLMSHGAAAAAAAPPGDDDSHIHSPVPLRPRASPEPEDFEHYHNELFDEVNNEDGYEDYRAPSQTHYARHDRAHSVDVEQDWQAWNDRTRTTYHSPSTMQGSHSRSPIPNSPKYNNNDHHYGQQRSYSDQPTQPYDRQFRPNHMHSDAASPCSSAPVSMRPGPLTVNSDSQLQQLRRHPRPQSMSPQKAQMTRDSPLRQSVSNHESPYDSLPETLPPPIPPKHQESQQKRSQTDFPPSAYSTSPLRPGADASSIGERSPLQSLEDGYLTQIEKFSPPRKSAGQRIYNAYDNVMPPYEKDQQMYAFDRRMSWQERDYIPMPEPEVFRQQAQHYQGHGYNSLLVDEPQAMDERFESALGEDAHQPSVENAPPSPGLQPAVQRKAVGDQPKRLSTLPFDPDSYEVLNPGAPEMPSPATATAEQAKEFQRMKEVEKLRDLGPIIGNDGRVIDPSDHLPSDTWAPEPERKNKMPEHVIHIRSRNGPAGARANIVVRHNGSANFATTSAPNSSPASVGRAQGRATAVRQEGARPLPTQPYPSALTPSPTSASPSNVKTSFPPVAARPSPANRRVSWNEHDLVQEIPPFSRAGKRSSWVERPDKSEYQVSPTNSRTARGQPLERQVPPQAYSSYRARTNPMRMYTQSEQSSSTSRPSSQHGHDNMPPLQHSWSSTSPNLQQQGTNDDNWQNHHDDPLAAEMSTIDLGPSRYAPRNSKGHRNSNGNATGHGRQKIYGQGYNHDRGMSMPAINMTTNTNTNTNMNRSMVRVWNRY